jgi:hypothetical protein
MILWVDLFMDMCRDAAVDDDEATWHDDMTIYSSLTHLTTAQACEASFGRHFLEADPGFLAVPVAGAVLGWVAQAESRGS